MQFVVSQGWKFKEASSPNIEIEKCPYCKDTGHHLRMEIQGTDSELKNRDGLHICMKCTGSGNLYALKQHLGLITAGMESRKDFAASEKKVDTLPDVDEIHQALLEDIDTMDYLMNVRGFSRAVIEKQKLGYIPKHFFKGQGEVPALVYPYLQNGNCIFVHYRTLPPVPKAFSSPTGWQVPLYNGEVLHGNLSDVILVEGEPDCIAAIDHGVQNICGVPGAAFKKAEWIDQLDKIDKIYICYDKDIVGQRAAQELATRVGIEKCYKLILPDFDVPVEGTETTKKGKDLNEWFVHGGGTSEKLDAIKADAQLFDVAGVANSKDAVQEFMDELEGKEGLEPKYKTNWPSLNQIVGFDPGDVIDVLAPEKIGKTTFVMNLVEHMVNEYGEDGVLICLEMTRAKMARKWIAHKGQIADNIPKSPEASIALKENFKYHIPKIMEQVANRDGDFYFCYPKYKTVDDIYNLMRDCIRRYGVKWIAIDNIQRLCDTTLGDKNRTQHLSEISKVTSQIAKDYNVQMVRILQPNRIADGKIVGIRNTDGSSQIAKDCDCTIVLHRESTGEINQEQLKSQGGVVQQTESFSDVLVTLVPLSRYSGGGGCTLHMNGATSTVSEMKAGEILKMQAEANKNVGNDAINKSLGLKDLKDALKPIESTTDDGSIAI